MNLAWDYTKLAAGYVKRPEYASNAVDKMLENLGEPVFICDIGAGDGHLTLELLQRDKNVVAVEPNDAMRENGDKKTTSFKNVKWIKGTAENTNQLNDLFDAVTFGSSFNVCDQIKSLGESKRICKKGAGFACLWNHRNLDDSIQCEIENIIKNHIKNYDYGNRRADQATFLNSCGFLTDVKFISGEVTHEQSIGECIEAWRSHGTLYRQCKDDEHFNAIIDDIECYLKGLKKSVITVPYTTRIWTAKFI